jgi:arylsulfatase
LGIGSSNEADSTPGYLFASEVHEWILQNVQSSEFTWGHFMDPHFPFTNATAPTIDNVEEDMSKINKANDAYVDYQSTSEQLRLLRELYNKNIEYLDSHLVSLLDTLEDRGWYDELTIILTADHGEAFGEHGVKNHDWGACPIDELIKVPLFVKPAGGIPSAQITQFVNHKNLYQTICHLLRNEPVENTPLYGESFDYTISKSNGYIRCSEKDGGAYKSRDGEIISGSEISKKGLAALRESSFTKIESTSGEVIGTESTDVEKQLEALGYR